MLTSVRAKLNVRQTPKFICDLILKPKKRISSSTPRSKLNRGLESVKEQGMHILDATVSDIQSKTNRRLLLEDEDTGPTSYQLKEASKLKRLVEDALDVYTSNRGNSFCIMNEPISIIDVEITEDLRQARVFWSLPYSVLMLRDRKLNRDAREILEERMQKILNEKGGVLQGLVHQKLRSYYRPPKLRFVQAESEMLRKSLHELFMT